MQGEQYSPFRALVNMVPEQGVPKYDFLRKMLQGSLDSRNSTPAGMLTQPSVYFGWACLRPGRPSIYITFWGFD